MATAPRWSPREGDPMNLLRFFDLRLHDEPTDEEKKEAERVSKLTAEQLKEEAKKAFEARDKAKADARAAEDARKAAETKAAEAEAARLAAEKKAEEAETARKKIETEKAASEGNLETALKNVREETAKALEDQRKKDAEEQAKRDQEAADRSIRIAAGAALREQGLIDKALVDQFERKDLKIDEDGEIVGLDEFVKAAREAKPHFFGEPQQRDEGGRFATSPRPTTKAGEFDWSTIKPGTPEWDARKKALLGSRA